MMQTATEDLVLASVMPGQKRPPDAPLLNLNDVIRERLSLYAQLCGSHTSLYTELKPNLDPACITEFHMERLLLNLILCAKYSMPFGGKLLLSTANATVDGERYVRLLLDARRNPPDESIPLPFDRKHDLNLVRQMMRKIVSSNSGMLAVCQQTELSSTTEVLLPCAIHSRAGVQDVTSVKRITALPT